MHSHPPDDPPARIASAEAAVSLSRHLARRAALVLALAFLAAWVLGAWWIVSFGGWRVYWMVGAGVFMVQFDDPAMPGGPLEWWFIRVDAARYSWWSRTGCVLPTISFGPPRGAFLLVPLWLPAGSFGLAAWLLRTRRAPAGHCAACGYDLRGNRSGVCPECGRATRTRPLLRPGRESRGC